MAGNVEVVVTSGTKARACDYAAHDKISLISTLRNPVKLHSSPSAVAAGV